jgi:cytochrome b561
LPGTSRYTAVAIVLHWAIAAAIVANLLLSWWMHRAIEVQETQARAIAAFQLHKSLGLTILVLSLLRLVWRLLHRPPSLPAAMPAWEQFAAKATHWCFYAFMVLVPLSGWLYVSTQWRGQAPLNVPTLWFGLFEVPHLLGLNELARETRQALAAVAFSAHLWLAWGMAGLLVLHVGAALKHHFVNRDEILANMLPLVRAANQPAAPRYWPRTVALAAGSTLILIGAVAFAWAVVKPPSAGSLGAGAIGDLPGEGGAAAVPAWSVQPDSEIAFSGVHAGTPFKGRFANWRAGIHFDPANLSGSSITAVVETGSARDGDALHEETLPQAEWFDVARHPTATFRTIAIRARGDGGYDLEGTLTIKDRELPLTPLVLNVDGARLSIGGQVSISRRDANLGMESDPDAEYVSADIAVDVRVTARRGSN